MYRMNFQVSSCPSQIMKRDGRTKKFNPEKIYHGIMCAMEKAGFPNEALAEEITVRVIIQLTEDPASSDDIYQKVLIELINAEQNDVVAGYIHYRDERTENREVKSGLMKVIDSITKEVSKDNANVLPSPSARMLQIGEAASNWYNLAHMPKHIAQAHIKGWIHIHDLGFYEKTINCLQIDLGRLLAEGFDAGRGYIRPPKRIASAAALSAIIIQSNQNDMFGGQSYPYFDTYLAPYVPKDYAKALSMCDQAETEGHANLFIGRVEQIRDEVYQAMESLVYNLNSLMSRAGAQAPFSSLNFGTDTTPSGRLITEMLLKAYDAGLGRGETPLFPNLVFRVKSDINQQPGTPNYDLYQLALRVAGRQMNPTFSFMDSSFNKAYGDKVAYMGCRTRVVANVNGDAQVEGRGNIGFVTMNLPRCAIEAKGSVDKFYKNLDKLLQICEEQLMHRYETACRLRAKDLPFLMGQKLYMDSDKLKPEESIREAIKHGTLSIGFIGLAETLMLLLGTHHGDSEDAYKVGYEIIEYIKDRVNDMATKHQLNFTTLATPAEGLSGRFIKLDREKYGAIQGITDKGFYTNSFHIPVDYKIGMFKKLELEGSFHKLCNAGHISYVELKESPYTNGVAMEQLINFAGEQDMGYVGVNFPIDYCATCGTRGLLHNDECPKCGSTDIKRIRRITGYLSLEENFGAGKAAELKARVSHN